MREHGDARGSVGPRRNNVTPDEAAEIVALRRSGLSAAQVASRLGRGRRTVERHLAYAEGRVVRDGLRPAADQPRPVVDLLADALRAAGVPEGVVTTPATDARVLVTIHAEPMSCWRGSNIV